MLNLINWLSLRGDRVQINTEDITQCFRETFTAKGACLFLNHLDCFSNLRRCHLDTFLAAAVELRTKKLPALVVLYKMQNAKG